MFVSKGLKGIIQLMSIPINKKFSIDNQDIQFIYKRASGPGGQNINKVSSAAQLRFDTSTGSLPEDVRHRLIEQAKNRINEQGILIINANRYRSQEKNRQDAIDRLVALLKQAARKPPGRKKTKPTPESVRKRLEEKKKISQLKKQRDRTSYAE